MHHLSVNEFSDWLKTAQCGSQIRYAATPNLARECEESEKSEKSELKYLRDIAYSAAARGEVFLFQKSVILNDGGRSFDYIAVRAGVPKAMRPSPVRQ